jgi:hypothetical protein
LAQFALTSVVHSLKDKRTRYLLCRQAIPTGLGIFQTTLEIPAHPIYQVSVYVNKIGDSQQNRLQPHTLVEKVQIGKADLGH